MSYGQCHWAHILTAGPFGTLKLARALRQARFTNEQAEGAAEAIAGALQIADVLQADLGTKSHLAEVKADLKRNFADLKPNLKATSPKSGASSANKDCDLAPKSRRFD